MTAIFPPLFRFPHPGPRVLALGLALLPATLPTGAEDWPQWRGPQRNGISSEKEWTADFPAQGPTVLWKANVGLGFAGIAVAAGRAYTTGNKADKDTVHCFDAVTGQPVWQFTYDHPVDAKYYPGGTSATPTVDGDRVYTLSKRGQLHCFDAATGEVKWKKNLAEEIGAKRPTWGFASSVLIDGDRAVVNVGTHGTAVDKRTGAVVWKSGTAESGYATPVPFEQGGQKLYLVFAAKGLVAVQRDTGKEVWSYPWKTSYDVNAADPVLVDGQRIVISSGYERGGALLDVAGGQPKVVWENKNLRSMLNAGVLIGDHIYAIDGNTEKGQLTCVEVATGKVAWTFKDPSHGALTAANGKLIVVGEKGELVIGDANPAGFKPSARAQIGGGTYWTAPVLANGRLYVRNGEGQVTCLDLRATKVASAL